VTEPPLLLHRPATYRQRNQTRTEKRSFFTLGDGDGAAIVAHTKCKHTHTYTAYMIIISAPRFISSYLDEKTQTL
jgi:hypothetical protein